MTLQTSGAITLSDIQTEFRSFGTYYTIPNDTRPEGNSPELNSYSTSDVIFNIKFTTGSDITTGQVIWETGGSVLGSALGLSNGNLEVFAGNDATVYATHAISANTSYHVSVIIDMTNDIIKLYVSNSVTTSADLVDSSSFTQSDWAGINNTGVGVVNDASRATYSGSFLGSINSVLRIYTTNDITAIYNEGVSAPEGQSISISDYYRGGPYVPNIPVNNAIPLDGNFAPISFSDFYGAKGVSSLSTTAEIMDAMAPTTSDADLVAARNYLTSAAQISSGFETDTETDRTFRFYTSGETTSTYIEETLNFGARPATLSGLATEGLTIITLNEGHYTSEPLDQNLLHVNGVDYSSEVQSNVMVSGNSTVYDTQLSARVKVYHIPVALSDLSSVTAGYNKASYNMESRQEVYVIPGIWEVLQNLAIPYTTNSTEQKQISVLRNDVILASRYLPSDNYIDDWDNIENYSNQKRIMRRSTRYWNGSSTEYIRVLQGGDMGFDPKNISYIGGLGQIESDNPPYNLLQLRRRIYESTGTDFKIGTVGISSTKGEGQRSTEAVCLAPEGYDQYLAFVSSDYSNPDIADANFTQYVDQIGGGANTGGTVYFGVGDSYIFRTGVEVDFVAAALVPISGKTYSSSAFGADQDLTPPSVSCNEGDVVLVAIFTEDTVDPTLVPPTGYTLIKQVNGLGGSEQASSVSIAYKEISVNGVETPGAWSGIDTSNCLGAITVRLS